MTTEAANAARNRNRDGRGAGRLLGWRPSRDALWALVDGLVADGARVAIVGAGNADTIPLLRIARRAARVDLIDLARPQRGGRGGAWDHGGGGSACCTTTSPAGRLIASSRRRPAFR